MAALMIEYVKTLSHRALASIFRMPDCWLEVFGWGRFSGRAVTGCRAVAPGRRISIGPNGCSFGVAGIVSDGQPDGMA